MGSEVSITPFKFKHLSMLIDMHRRQEYLGLPYITMKTLPKIGYIALLGTEPVAAGFLRRVEGGFAQIDTLVSNPYLGSLVRNEGIDKIVNTLISDAKDLRLHGILATTDNESVISRGREKGFKILDSKLLGLLL